MEAGILSPWIGRLFSAAGLEVIVANARKLRAIYDNERKCDRTDARMLARLGRVDPAMLHPVCHIGEDGQRDLLLLKLRDTLVRQLVALINSVRACLKSLGLRLPLTTTTAASLRRARPVLKERDPALAAMLESALEALGQISRPPHHLSPCAFCPGSPFFVFTAFELSICTVKSATMRLSRAFCCCCVSPSRAACGRLSRCARFFGQRTRLTQFIDLHSSVFALRSGCSRSSLH